MSQTRLNMICILFRIEELIEKHQYLRFDVDGIILTIACHNLACYGNHSQSTAFDNDDGFMGHHPQKSWMYQHPSTFRVVSLTNSSSSIIMSMVIMFILMMYMLAPMAIVPHLSFITYASCSIKASTTPKPKNECNRPNSVAIGCPRLLLFWQNVDITSDHNQYEFIDDWMFFLLILLFKLQYEGSEKCYSLTLTEYENSVVTSSLVE